MRVVVGVWLGCAWLAGCGATSKSGHDTPSAGASGTNAGLSGSGTGGSSGSNAGGSTAGGSAAVGGGGSGGSSGSAGAGGEAQVSGHHGQVAVINRFVGPLSATVYFIESTSGSGAPCTFETAGGCSIAVCDDGPSTTMTTYASAGTVTVTSPDVEGELSYSPDLENRYFSPAATPTLSFGGGEQFQVVASGADVPAFQQPMTMPLVLLLSQPLFTTGSPGVFVSQSQDLSLVWTRGVENVSLYIQAVGARVDGMPGSSSLLCTFPSTAGTAVIPATLLHQLPIDTKLSAYTTTTTTVKAGDYDILVAAVTAIANPDKTIVPAIILAE